MSVQITTAFVQQYSSNVMMLAQQKASRLRNTVTVMENVIGKSAFMDQVGQTAMQAVISRHSDTPINSTPHSRRRVNLTDYENGDLIDDMDKVKTLIDPQNAYVQAMAAGAGRQIDDIIIAAAFADAQTGETGATTVAFPAAQQIAVNSWAFGEGSGNAGLTVSKLIEARNLLGSADVDVDDPEELTIVCHQRQVSNLLATTEVTNDLYTEAKALATGKVNSFMGFNFKIVNRLPLNGSSHRRVLVYARSGLGLAIGSDIKAKIAEDPSKRFATRVYFSLSAGATRLEENKVVEIVCSES